MLMLLCSCKQEEQTELKIGYISQYDANENQLTSAILNGLDLLNSETNTNYKFVKIDESINSSDAIAALYNNGCRIIISSEYAVSDAVKSAQKEYKDCFFACIGYSLSSPADNTVNITFSEHESGFIAGIATALKIQNGNAAAILGMDLPSTNRYVNGFNLGINYANQHFGTSVTLSSENIIYIGSYNDPELAKNISEALYNNDVKCIFTDGGKTSDGIFNAARELRTQHSDIWVISVETDKYDNGILHYNYSVTLTTVLNNYTHVVSNIVARYISNCLSGAKILNYGIIESGICLPDSNPNLPDDILTKCQEVITKIYEKNLVIPNTESLLD